MPLIVDSAQMPQKLCKNSKKRDTVPTNVSFFAKLLLFPSKIPKNEERIIYFLKSASNLNGNLNCSKELEHYAS